MLGCGSENESRRGAGLLWGGKAGRPGSSSSSHSAFMPGGELKGGLVPEGLGGVGTGIRRTPGLRGNWERQVGFILRLIPIPVHIFLKSME